VERSRAQALHPDRSDRQSPKAKLQRLLLVAAQPAVVLQVALLVAARAQAAQAHSQREVQVTPHPMRVQQSSSAATSEQAAFERVRPKKKVRSRYNYRRSTM
jgi:hypothetical protein